MVGDRGGKGLGGERKRKEKEGGESRAEGRL